MDAGAAPRCLNSEVHSGLTGTRIFIATQRPRTYLARHCYCDRTSKRHLLVDGRGVPLSFIVTGANVNDLTKLDDVLAAIVVKRPRPAIRRSKHLCADAGYRSRVTGELIESHGYIAHVVDRHQEKERKARNPTKKARRWVVEVCHSWFNRFRKLLVRYEKGDVPEPVESMS